MFCKIIITLFFLNFYSILGAQTRNLILKAGNSDSYPKENLILIFDSTKVNVEPSGLSHFFNHTLYKVLTAEGAKKIAVITLDYDPLSAFVEFKEVTLYRNDGKEEKLNLDRVLDYPAPARAIYWGARQKMIEIGRLEPGDAVEVKTYKKGFTYALLQQNVQDEEKYIPPMKGHFYDIVNFWNENLVLSKVYQVTLPLKKKVQYKFYHGEAAIRHDTTGNHVTYFFSMKNVAKPPYEPHTVATSDIAPKLLLSTSPDWEAKSLWFYHVNEDFGSFKSTNEVDKKVREILWGAKNENDSISRLTHWVADEMRYSGLSMGEGEGFTLHKAEMNFTDRCGVCKDKAGMLITMLRSAGFESYPAMTMAGSRIDRVPADQFNHCVTVVKRKDGQYELLDPTWVPFTRELWSSLEQQQNYLMGVSEGADLMITQVSGPENHYIRINGTSQLLENGTLQGKIHVQAEGQSDRALRSIFIRRERDEWQKAIELVILSFHPRMEIIELSYSDPEQYLTQPMELTLTYRIPGYAVVTADEILFTPFTATHLFKNLQSHLQFDTSLESRKYPFRDRCSKLIELKESITLPGYKKVIYIPENQNLDGSGAAFQSDMNVKENVLDFNEKIELKKRIYEPSDWPSFRETVKAQNKLANDKIILQRN